MRRIILALATICALAQAFHAQTKITALPAATPAATDIVPFVADPTGTAVTKKTTVADLLGAQHTSCASNQFGNSVSAAGVLGCAQPAFSNLLGAISTAQQPSTTVNSVVNDTNVTGSISAQALTLGFTGALSKARQHAATVYNDQANSYSSGSLQSFFSGTNFELKDPTTSTKKAQWDLSNITAGNTRTVNVPDANATLAQARGATSHQFLTSMSAQGVFSAAQPAQADVSGLGTGDSVQHNSLGLGVAAPSTAGQINTTLGANNVTGFTMKRNTDTSPAGAFTDFQNAAGSSLWKVDITGSLAAGTVPVSTGISGLGTGVATFLATPSGANLASALTTALPVSKGGTNATSASITAFNNITGYTAAGATGTTSTNLVFSTSPVLVTPTLGAATATSINFGGTTLSTYVEGTFTPALNFGGATTGITYTTQVGRYTQTGDVVTVWITIVLSSKGTATGSATISGLPTNAANVTGFIQSNAADIYNATYTGATFAFINPASSLSAIQLDVTNNGTRSSMTDANFGNTTAIQFTMQYRTN